MNCPECDGPCKPLDAPWFGCPRCWLMFEPIEAPVGVEAYARRRMFDHRNPAVRARVATANPTHPRAGGERA